MFQMSEKIAFLSKKLSNSKEFDLTVINPILSRKSWSTQGNIDLPWKIGSYSEKFDQPDQRTPGEEWSASVWRMRPPDPDQWLSKRKKEIRSLIPERKTSLLWHTTNSFLCTRRPADSNFPRGKFCASTDWLSLYPPLSRLKPVQAFLIRRLAYIEPRQCVLDVFAAAK